MEDSKWVVVVGADFARGGDVAILHGLELAARGAASKVHLVHVLDPADVIDDPHKPVLTTEEEVLECAPAVLRGRAHRLAREAALTCPDERLAMHVRIGKAVPSLAQVAVDYDADLLVVGTHGRKGLDRLLLGSVAEQLVRTARCPVLVARPKDYTGCAKTPRPDPPYAPGEAPKYSAPREVQVQGSTQLDSWEPSGGAPTGFRIV